MEPKFAKQALTNPTWLAAMKVEYDAFINNGTWTHVSLPPNKVLFGCKWVFKIKENPDGTISKYKARLLAKGFHQNSSIQLTSAVIQTQERHEAQRGDDIPQGLYSTTSYDFDRITLQGESG